MQQTQEDETNKGRSGIEQCVKKKLRRESNMVCVERLDYARSPDGGACSRSRTVALLALLWWCLELLLHSSCHLLRVGNCSREAD
jgi:hypothetical protein